MFSPRALVEAWLRAINQHDAAAVARLYSPSARTHEVGGTPAPGRDAVLAGLAALFHAMPDMTLALVTVIGDESAVAAEIEASGTSAIGKVVVRGAAFFEVTDGAIRTQRVYWDAPAKR